MNLCGISPASGCWKLMALHSPSKIELNIVGAASCQRKTARQLTGQGSPVFAIAISGSTGAPHLGTSSNGLCSSILFRARLQARQKLSKLKSWLSGPKGASGYVGQMMRLEFYQRGDIIFS